MDRNELKALQAALRGALATSAALAQIDERLDAALGKGADISDDESRGARTRHACPRRVCAGAAGSCRDDANTARIIPCPASVPDATSRDDRVADARAMAPGRQEQFCARMRRWRRSRSIAHGGNRVIESLSCLSRNASCGGANTLRAGARSSAGRALRSQCRGREFDPPRVHHPSLMNATRRMPAEAAV